MATDVPPPSSSDTLHLALVFARESQDGDWEWTCGPQGGRKDKAWRKE